MIAAIKNDSPLKDQFQVSMVIYILSLPDGTLYSGLSSIELANVLRGSTILEGRDVCLVNPKTMKLTEKAIDARSSTAGAITHDISIVTGDISGVASPGNVATIANAVSYDEADIAVTGSKDCSTNIGTYQDLDMLLFGMNHKQIDWVEAQQMMANGNQDDAVIIAYRALLHHSKVFKSDKLIKNEMEALSMWNRAERLGLSDQDLLV